MATVNLGVCAVDGCGRPHNCKGMCRMHYKRMQKSGTTDPPPSRRGICIVSDCGGSHYAVGLCKSHYKKSRYQYQPKPDPTIKKCPICQRVLPRTEFGTRVADSGNRVSRSKCRECERAAAYTAYDSEKAATIYRLRNAVRIAARARRDPIKLAEWRRTLRREAENRRRARKKDAVIFHFTAKQLEARLSMFPGCWMCGGDKETVDHVKPLAKGGAHTLANLRPACKSCNSRKRSSWPIKDALIVV